MTLPRLLFVTHRFPYPLIGGAPLRVFNLVSQLSKAFDVTLVALCNSRNMGMRDALKQTGIRELHCVPHSVLQGALATLAALPSQQPLNVAYYKSPVLRHLFAELLPRHDLCVIHGIRISGNLCWQTDIPIALDMCDATGFNFALTAAQGHLLSPWRLISAIDAPRTTAFEFIEPQRFDLVSIHTRGDAARAEIPKDRLLISTMGTNVSEVTWTSPAERQGRSIALIGKMDFFPNWHGAQWLAREVLPLLPQDMRLKVIGLCPPKVRALFKSFSRVDVTGRVDSLEDACRDCYAAVAPMRVASGIQNKVLEYFAMGLPAVLSPVVSNGLLDEAKGSYYLADNREEWANALTNIRSNPATVTDMAKRARQYVEHYHNWDQIGAEYVDRLMALLTAKRRRGLAMGIASDATGPLLESFRESMAGTIRIGRTR